MGRQSEFIADIANRVGCSSSETESAFHEHGVPLVVGHRAQRHLRLHRLRIRGTKTSKVEPGAFDSTFVFPTGVTVISAGNLRGKSSILEIIAFVLRGTPGGLQSDTISWLSDVSLDVSINDAAFGFRLSLNAGDLLSGRILEGSVADLSASDNLLSNGVVTVSASDDPDEWAATVAAFMLQRLSLDEIVAFNKSKTQNEAGIIKSHGWPMYFSTLFPPSGAEKILLGNTVADNLPVRLLQVFLDQPDAVRLARIGALARRIRSEHSAAASKRQASMRGLQARTAEAEQALLLARSRLADLATGPIEEDLMTLGKRAQEAGERFSALRTSTETLRESRNLALAARLMDERALLDLSETTVAQALFHGLDPANCPRCEKEIPASRKKTEATTHQCSVCDSSLPVLDDDDAKMMIEQAQNSVQASRAAETAFDQAFRDGEAKLRAAAGVLRALDIEVAAAGAAQALTDRGDAELGVATAKAVLDTLQSIPGEETLIPQNQRIFEVAEALLKEEIRASGQPLYDDLNHEVYRLAMSFGMAELEIVRVKPQQLQMDVTKGGGNTSSFSSQSPGERLRLRYALLIALLRVARNHQIAGHPGLLLLDSLKAEEVQADHARTLLEGLVQAAQDEPGLQILVTTEDGELAGSVSGVASSISPSSGRTTLF